MSLINQMLQDLEKRRASGAERGALPNQVRVLPQRESRGMLRWIAGLTAGIALLALAAWHFSHPPASPTLSQNPQVEAPVISANGPASRLALDLQPPPAGVLGAAAPVARESTAAAPVPRKVAPREEPAAPREKPVREKVATEKVVVAAAPPAVISPPPAAAPAPSKAEVVKQPSSKQPGVTPAVTALPAAASTEAAAPVVPPASKPVEKAVDSKVQVAASNAQIDKRNQQLSPQQAAENEYREAANFLNQGRHAEAQEGFKRALQINPAHAGARQALFGLLVDAKKMGEAEQLLHEGLAVNPNQPGLAMALSGLQYERGNINEAIETMQKSAPVAQSSPDYLARLAALLQRQSRHREAVENYQAALRIAPGSGVWLMGLGISLQALNRTAEAQDAFRRARSSNSLNPELQAFVDQRLKQLQ